MTKPKRNAIEQIEWMRNLLAFMLVGAFISMLPALMIIAIPSENKDIINYIAGQLSGMATLALGFYFVNKVGQDALEAKRSDNTGKLADAVTKALDATPAAPVDDPSAIKDGDEITINKDEQS